MNCAFCASQEIKDRTIIENDLAFAFPTNTPIVPGHLLICPKRHIQYYEDATQEEKNAIETLRETLKIALEKSFKAEGFNYAWNEAIVGGQTIPHFHLHVVPRKEGDSGIFRYEPREFLYRPGPRSGVTPAEELLEVVGLIKKALNDPFRGGTKTED